MDLGLCHMVHCSKMKDKDHESYLILYNLLNVDEEKEKKMKTYQQLSKSQ